MLLNLSILNGPRETTVYTRRLEGRRMTYAPLREGRLRISDPIWESSVRAKQNLIE